MVMEASPSPQSVGREFVRQYYTLLNKAPAHLHRFYNNYSSFVHGGLDAPNRETLPVVGQKQIHNRIQQLNFRDCHAKISQVDAQATLGNGVVVQVTGELSNGGAPMRRFTQTFVLAAQSPKKYYVHNDIFRYQDIVFSDEEGSGSGRSEGEEDEAGGVVAAPAYFPGPRRYSDAQQLFLGNLPHCATEEELRLLFARFGAVAELRVHSKPAAPGAPRHPNYGFITYETSQAAHDCLNAAPLYFPADSADGVKLNAGRLSRRGTRALVSICIILTSTSCSLCRRTARDPSTRAGARARGPGPAGGPRAARGPGSVTSERRRKDGHRVSTARPAAAAAVTQSDCGSRRVALLGRSLLLQFGIFINDTPMFRNTMQQKCQSLRMASRACASCTPMSVREWAGPLLSYSTSHVCFQRTTSSRSYRLNRYVARKAALYHHDKRSARYPSAADDKASTRTKSR
uniref:NTF2 domain-containing protein n=1 Tax=Heliothis virescens TaxID=7102 RepID=A0A2A4JBQ0_HELVI